MRRLRAIERKHIALVPEGEKLEVRHMLRCKGIEGTALELAVQSITANEELWINTMLAEEYGIAPTTRSPTRAAAYTLLAFLLCGSAPLIPFAVGAVNAFAVASLFTALVFFAIGSLKSHWALQPWWRSGLGTLAVGTAAAAIAFLVGRLLAQAGVTDA